MAAVAAPVVVDFSDLSLPPSSYWCGPVPNGTLQPDPYGGYDLVGQFTSGGVAFMNNYSLEFGSWEGFSYSNVNDTTTPGYTNQFAASTGTAVSGAGNAYAVAYTFDEPATLSLPQATSLSGMYITNTTYAYLSMLDGDGFSKQFTPSDWFLLTIAGLNSNNQPTGAPISFYLAQNGNIVNNWNWVSLSGLGKNVRTLDFTLSSSDNGEYGMNTPAYFAMDDLTYAGPLTWTGTSRAWSNSANWGGTAPTGS
jgi:hypothetical protein